MRNCTAAALAVLVALVLCSGCAGGADIKDTAGADQPQEGTKLTEWQLEEVMKSFPGISMDDTAAVWIAKEAAAQAEADFRGYWTLRSRTKQDNPQMLELAIETHRRAKELLEPLGRKYPQSDSLNDTADFVIQGLRSLEEQKRKADR